VQRLLAVVAMGAGAALGALIVINISTALALALAAVVFTAAGVVMVVATTKAVEAPAST
jgi:hypothetical protein